MMVAYVWVTKCERAADCRSAFACASGSAGSAPSPFSFLASSTPPISSSSWPSASSASGRGPSGASKGLSDTCAGVAVAGSLEDSLGGASSSMLVSMEVSGLISPEPGVSGLRIESSNAGTSGMAAR